MVATPYGCARPTSPRRDLLLLPLLPLLPLLLLLLLPEECRRRDSSAGASKRRRAAFSPVRSSKAPLCCVQFSSRGQGTAD
eukprot:scaffold35124_cov51-Phaeocystis_antarctica.AAC.7